MRRGVFVLGVIAFSLMLAAPASAGEQGWNLRLYGAGIASVDYGNLHYVDPEGDPLDIKVDGDISWSAKAGLDLALGQESSWSAVGGLRYIDSDVEFRNVDDDAGNAATLSFDIFSFSGGIAYSF